tara:strand:+ start:95 stop:490 length:396 start_codon:yes stop_codon:yes gene_type:complete
MAVIKPVLTITANASSATTEPGPASIAVSLSAKPTNGTSTVTALTTRIISVTSTHTEFHDASVVGACFIYLKNTGTTEVWVGSGANMGAGANRYLTLAAGEFAFMPWGDDTDLYADCEATGTLEYWVFDKS